MSSMTETLTAHDIRGLVRPDHVHRRAYADPAVFELEQERIFGRLWIYVAHESQLRKPGDFVRTRLAAHEVLVTRHHEGHIWVLHNRCPHRGARLCMVDRGSSRLFSCPYHAWVFRPDGSLASVPHRKSYPENFDLADPQNHMRRDGARRELSRLRVRQPRRRSGAARRASRRHDRRDRQPGRPRARRRGRDRGFGLHAGISRQLEAPHGERRRHLPPELRAQLLGHAGPARRPRTRRSSTRTRRARCCWPTASAPSNGKASQLNGLPGGHTFMSSFYNRACSSTRRAIRSRRATRPRWSRGWGRNAPRSVLGDEAVQQHHLSEPVLNAQYQQMRVTIPLAVDRTIVRIHCFRLQRRARRDVSPRGALPDHLGSPASMIFSDDVEMLERCQQGLVPAGRPLGRLLARARQRSSRRRTDSVSGAASEMPMRVQFEAWVDCMTAEAA